MKNRIFSLLIAMLLLVCMALPAGAAAQGDCSIEVKVEYKDKKINGGELIAIRVGYADWEDGCFRQLTDHIEIEDIGTSKAVSKMLRYYNKEKYNHAFDRYVVPVSDGKAVFENIPEGLYLIYQEKAAKGYNNLAPFLVTLPYTTVDGQLITAVTADAKSELDKHPHSTTTPTSPTSPTNPGGQKPPKPTQKPPQKLPQTGQLTWPIPWMASGGMLTFAFGWWLCFGNRKDSYET